jgi:hypothetical protein
VRERAAKIAVPQRLIDEADAFGPSKLSQADLLASTQREVGVAIDFLARLQGIG